MSAPGINIPLSTTDNFAKAKRQADDYAKSLVALANAIDGVNGKGPLQGGFGGGMNSRSSAGSLLHPPNPRALGPRDWLGNPSSGIEAHRRQMQRDQEAADRKRAREQRQADNAGPFSRLDAARRKLAADPDNKDLQYHALVARRQADHADQLLNPTSPKNLLQKFSGGTRIGQSLAAMGVGSEALAAMAGPVAVVAVAVAGIALLAKAAEHAAGDINNLSAAKFGGGGTLGQTRNALGIGAATGMDVTAVGHAISNQIMSNGAAASIASRLGVPLYRGKFGDMNDTGAALKIIKDIVNDPSEQSAQRKMRMFEGAIPDSPIAILRAASPEIKKMALQAQSADADPKTMQEAADAQIQLNLAMNEFSKLITQVGATVLPVVNVGLRALIKGPAEFASGIADLLTGNPGGALNHFGSAIASSSTDSNSPVNENTKAIRENTEQVRRVNTNFEQGHYGASFGSAIPQGLGTRQFNAHVNGGAEIPWGVF